jgi:hypothetical protein
LGLGLGLGLGLELGLGLGLGLGLRLGLGLEPEQPRLGGWVAPDQGGAGEHHLLRRKGERGLDRRGRPVAGCGEQRDDVEQRA